MTTKRLANAKTTKDDRMSVKSDLTHAEMSDLDSIAEEFGVSRKAMAERIIRAFLDKGERHGEE